MGKQQKSKFSGKKFYFFGNFAIKKIKLLLIALSKIFKIIRLSERNCIEIVANLIDTGLINVVHSIDGKDYITNDYLATQIINETIGNGGFFICL